MSQSRDAVVDAALALVEAEGPAALTMRRLAAELDVATTTIYWHVGGRDDLVLALIGRLAEGQGAVAVGGDTAPERVLAVLDRVWHHALEHRHVTSLAHQVGATALLEAPLERALARELHAAGLRGEALRDAQRALLGCLAGFLVVAFRAARPGAAQTSSPEALWAGLAETADAGDHLGLDAASLAALARPPDVARLARDTLRRLVEQFLDHPRETAP